MIGKLLQWFRRPGLVRPMEYRDPETGALILEVTTSPRYTIILSGDREFFFRRESGQFDGIGAMSVDEPSAMNGLMAERIRRLKYARASGGQPSQ